MLKSTFGLMGLVLLVYTGPSYSRLVDLSPDEKGDRIAVVKEGSVAYLPAKRINMTSKLRLPVNRREVTVDEFRKDFLGLEPHAPE